MGDRRERELRVSLSVLSPPGHPPTRLSQQGLTLGCSGPTVKHWTLPNGLCYQGEVRARGRDNPEQRSSTELVGAVAAAAAVVISFQTLRGCRRTCLDRPCCWLALLMLANHSLVEAAEKSFSDCHGTHLGIKRHLCISVAQSEY